MSLKPVFLHYIMEKLDPLSPPPYEKSAELLFNISIEYVKISTEYLN